MKRFLSQTEVPWTWALKHGLEDPYRLHQWIWNSLPDNPDVKRDFLFRSDVAHGILRILLLSERVPGESADATWRTTEVSPTFLGHRAYHFQLRANPTFRRASDHRRLAILDEAVLRKWFVRKFEVAGCEVDALELSAPRNLQFHKKGGAQPGTLSVVDAFGSIVVKDENAFRTAFDSGFGPAKGFGFGLLLLQPI